MNIKSLLIGSAAATVAVSGAKAADAIVIPEPEPMEYVRVCDVYGAGFFYIPGTETCLKVGGLVRFQVNWNEDDDGWDPRARGEVSFDARSETEYGTLRGLLVLRGDVANGDVVEDADIANDGGALSTGLATDEVGVQHAIIELGGLAMGVSDTLYDAGIFGEFDNGGGDRLHFVRYTFDTGGGFQFALALEEADNNYDYTPNVVGRLGVSQGWGSFNLWGTYDATAEEFTAKAIAAVNLTQSFSLEALATYESGQSFYSVENDVAVTTVGGTTYLTGYEWSAGGTLKFAATPDLTFGLGGQYFSEAHDIGGDDWAVGGVAEYYLVPNFKTLLAVNYKDGDNYADGQFSGFLRFDRTF